MLPSHDSAPLHRVNAYVVPIDSISFSLIVLTNQTMKFMLYTQDKCISKNGE